MSGPAAPLGAELARHVAANKTPADTTILPTQASAADSRRRVGGWKLPVTPKLAVIWG